MTMAGEPLVSVVTPFYNTEDYLADCIESVLAQTYRNFEYILQNNCSTDQSIEIAERYAQKDSRIRLYHNEQFVSQLQSYNQALRRISPESRYVKVVQADDSIFPRCLSDMVEVAQNQPTVAVVSSYRMNGANCSPRAGLPHTKTVMPGREACRFCLITGLSLFGSQTTVMVRSDIVRARDPFYAEERLFADSDAMYEILRDQDFGFVHQILSFTRLDPNSAWGRIWSYEPMLLDHLIRLKSFGRTYLSPDEYAEILNQQERTYRYFLADAWLKQREPAFWEFHRKGLGTIGETINWTELLLATIPVILQYAAQPQIVINGIARRVRHRFKKCEPNAQISSSGA